MHINQDKNSCNRYCCRILSVIGLIAAMSLANSYAAEDSAGYAPPSDHDLMLRKLDLEQQQRWQWRNGNYQLMLDDRQLDKIEREQGLGRYDRSWETEISVGYHYRTFLEEEVSDSWGIDALHGGAVRLIVGRKNWLVLPELRLSSSSDSISRSALDPEDDLIKPAVFKVNLIEAGAGALYRLHIADKKNDLGCWWRGLVCLSHQKYQNRR